MPWLPNKGDVDLALVPHSQPMAFLMPFMREYVFRASEIIMENAQRRVRHQP